MNDSDSEADPLAHLAEEFAGRYRRGERPSLTEYTERYPEQAERIRRLFPALVRFRREARAAARLHHTNIVPVFGVGEHEGVHYFAMQFIRGQGLDRVLHELGRLRRRGPPPPDADARRDADPSVSIARGLL